MNILNLRPSLSDKELFQKHEELVSSFPDFQFIPLNKSKRNIFSALYLRLKDSDLFRSEESIKSGYGYSVFNDLFIFPSHNIASLDNWLSKYDIAHNNILNKLGMDYNEHNISISLRNDIKNKFDIELKKKEDADAKMREEVKDKLISLGYVVSSLGHKGELYNSLAAKIEEAISPEQSLWSELKKDTSLVAKNIDSLLTSIFEGSGFFPSEFISYSPATDYDKITIDIEFAYRDYDSILNSNGVDSTPKFLAEELNKLNNNKAIAVSSRISNKHYLQIDFDTKDLSDVKTTIDKLGLSGGVIINSGNSFHYYNPSKLFSQREWGSMMDELKSFRSIGEFWPSFQQKQGFSMLRITPSFEKLYFPEIQSNY